MPSRLLAVRVRRILAATMLFTAVPLLALTVAQPWAVAGESMAPAIEDGALILVDTVGPSVTGYRRGDIVVVPVPDADPYPHRILVKRIVAVAGDRVRITDGVLEVNGAVLDEPYLAPGAVIVTGGRPTLELTVPERSVYVLGDRRTNSYDSKAFGPVPVETLRGRAWVALGPHDIRVQVPVLAGPGGGS